MPKAGMSAQALSTTQSDQKTSETSPQQLKMRAPYSAADALKQMATFNPAVPLSYVMAARKAAKLKNS